MKNALILHGTEGHNKENWFPWLEEQLKANGYVVWTPNLPQSNKPNIERYKEFVFPRWNFDEDSIIVGHSSGAVAALAFLQELPKEMKIHAVYSVAGFLGNLDWDALDDIASYPFRWTRLKRKVQKIVLFHSDDDPYVPLDHGKKLQALLNAELVIMPGQKHFSVSTEARYTAFPELLRKILE